MIDSQIFKGTRFQVHQGLPAEPNIVKLFPRVSGAEYQAYVDADTGLVNWYTESVGFIQNVYCSSGFLEKLKKMDLNK